MTTELIIQKELSPLAIKAKELEIHDHSDMTYAVELLSTLNKYIDSIEAKKNKVLKPLLEATKQERNRWKPVEKMHEEAILSVRGKMIHYQTEQVRLRRESEDAIVHRIGEGKGKIKIDTAVKKIESLTTPEKEVATDVGLVQFREKKQLKITDISLIPRTFLIPDYQLLLLKLKEGENIPGCEIKTIQVPVNYR